MPRRNPPDNYPDAGGRCLKGRGMHLPHPSHLPAPPWSVSTCRPESPDVKLTSVAGYRCGTLTPDGSISFARRRFGRSGAESRPVIGGSSARLP